MFIGPIKSHFKKGFTIVEILIVIVVIGILATISVVSYNGLTHRAHDTVMASEAKTFGQNVNIYYINNMAYGIDWSESAGMTRDEVLAKYDARGMSDRIYLDGLEADTNREFGDKKLLYVETDRQQGEYDYDYVKYSYWSYAKNAWIITIYDSTVEDSPSVREHGSPRGYYEGGA